MQVSETELLRQAKIAYAKKLQLKLYAQNPLKWLEEILQEDPNQVAWSRWAEDYETHNWDGDKDPLHGAWMALVNGDWAAVESATATGKTFWLARVALWFLHTNQNSLIVTSAPKQDQLNLNLWKELRTLYPKIKKHLPYSELLSLRLKADGRNGNDDLQAVENDWHIIGFVAGVGANEESATKAQGFHRARMLIITEETPGMNQAVMTAFENTCNSDPRNNLILAVGNPDSQVDVLHKFGKKSNVKAFRVSAYDHPNVVLKRTLIPGAVTLQGIKNRELDYGIDSNFYKSRVRGISPDQAIDSLIRKEWIEKAIILEKPSYGLGAVGIDVANSEAGDKASLAYGFDNVLCDLIEFQCPDASHLAFNLMWDDFKLETRGFHRYPIPKLTDYNITDRFIGIDVVGVGASTIHTFQNEGIQAVGLQGGQLIEAIPIDEITQKPLYEFVSGRAQWFWELREDLRQGNVSIAISDKKTLENLIEELTIIKFVLSRGKIAITAKDEIISKLGRSPNLADSFAYWNWIRKGHYEQMTGLSIPFYSAS